MTPPIRPAPLASLACVPLAPMALARLLRACLSPAAVVAACLLAACTQSGPTFEPPTACGYEPRAVLPLDPAHGRPIIEATIDGQPVRLIVDTGAETTLLTAEAAARLALPRGGSPMRLVGVGGEGNGSSAVARTLAFGGTVLRDFPLVIDGDAAGGGGFGLERIADGILGLDVLSHFDIDLDMPDARMTLYRPRDCGEGGPNWAVPYEILSAEITPRLHLIVPVGLDDMGLRATVDSGSDSTVLAERDLPMFGLTAAALRDDPVIRVRGIAPATRPIRVHRFNALTIGDDLILRPEIPVAPLPDFIGDALLGSDILHEHRVWLSWASARVYFAVGR
jgi:hypothetical protein